MTTAQRYLGPDSMNNLASTLGALVLPEPAPNERVVAITEALSRIQSEGVTAINLEMLVQALNANSSENFRALAYLRHTEGFLESLMLIADRLVGVAYDHLRPIYTLHHSVKEGRASEADHRLFSSMPDHIREAGMLCNENVPGSIGRLFKHAHNVLPEEEKRRLYRIYLATAQRIVFNPPNAEDSDMVHLALPESVRGVSVCLVTSEEARQHAETWAILLCMLELLLDCLPQPVDN